jgi:predicted RNA-binding protein
MNHWIVIVSKHGTLDAKEIFDQRMEDQFWGIGEKAPNRKNLNKDDRVVFYIATPTKAFAGTATLASPCFQLTESEKETYGHKKREYLADYGVHLDNIDVWYYPKSVETLVPQLNFIENKEYWGAYFQGGVRQLMEDDYQTIIGPSIDRRMVLEGLAEFSLESHLEDFLFHNWEYIDWGAQLELYKIDEQNGRQFPAGTWSIDLLAIDKDTRELVVIALKRGKPSDSVVAQILRYINWVKAHIATKDQKVRGIIITKEVPDKLMYAVKNIDYIEIKTYMVDFKLAPFEK